MNNRLLVTALATMSVVAWTANAGDHSSSSGHAGVQMMDTNQDGKVSADEHAAGAKAMFARMDADHDGNVTSAEMDAGRKAMKKDDHGAKHDEHSSSGDDHGSRQHDSGNKMSSADKIKVVDTNGDGILSAQEHEAGSQRMFAKMDADHDGALSAAEIDAGHKTMMKKTN